MQRLVTRIDAARPDILYAGLGSTKQGLVMAQLAARVAVPVMMAVGVTFSFVAGTVPRAPRWTHRIGLEWAWRLVREPRRLWRRYAMNAAVFPWLVLREQLRPRSRRRGPRCRRQRRRQRRQQRRSSSVAADVRAGCADGCVCCAFRGCDPSCMVAPARGA